MTIGMTIMNGSGGAVNTDTHRLLHCSLFPSQYYELETTKRQHRQFKKKSFLHLLPNKSGVGGAEILKKIVPCTRFNSYSIASQNQNVSYLITIQFNGTFGILNLKKVFSFVNYFFSKPLVVQLGRPGGVLCSGREVYLLLLKGTLKVTAPMAHNLCHRRARVVGTNIGTR